MNRRGFTLLEVTVALLVLSVAGAALTRTFTAVADTAVLVDRRQRAEVLAAEAMEAALAGHADAAGSDLQDWERDVSTSRPSPHLRGARVEVRHRTDRRIQVRIEGLAWVP